MLELKVFNLSPQRFLQSSLKMMFLTAAKLVTIFKENVLPNFVKNRLIWLVVTVCIELREVLRVAFT